MKRSVEMDTEPTRLTNVSLETNSKRWVLLGSSAVGGLMIVVAALLVVIKLVRILVTQISMIFMIKYANKIMLTLITFKCILEFVNFLEEAIARYLSEYGEMIQLITETELHVLKKPIIRNLTRFFFF